MIQLIALHIEIEGLVQGVGFRPFVYRLAKELNLFGWVRNTNESVEIRIEGLRKNTDRFISRVQIEKPAAAIIHQIKKSTVAFENYTSFSIIESGSVSEHITRVSPDIAVCNECCHDISHAGRRFHYSFVNCTNCGPRFTIIRNLPYDRKQTTMDTFNLCPDCAKEYNDINDRRFHAQPVACNICGPQYSLHAENTIITDIDEIIDFISNGLSNNKIYAIKSLGGYHLVCNPFSYEALEKLRIIKQRIAKPFALMFKDYAILRRYAEVSPDEKEALESFRRPIVIVKSNFKFDALVDAGLGTIGAMLPYTPFHHLLFEHSQADCFIMTSGNLKDEPVIIDDAKALQTFKNITYGVLTYNREILNRTDDSVIFFTNNKPRMIRRSRGFVPDPVRLPFDAEGIFATGAELTGAFCMGRGKQAIMGQYIGDLQDYENLLFYQESYNRVCTLFQFNPGLVVTDLHPDYQSTRFGQSLGIETMAVQHHHAHIASCMAEFGLDEKLIGIAFDGTGLGNDGTIWGSEFLLCDASHFERMAHLDYLNLPGGDACVKEPWRIAVSALYNTFGKDFLYMNFSFINQIDPKKLNGFLFALENNINTIASCSAGRWFDAVSAMLGLCLKASHQAEAPMKLEAIIDHSCNEAYTFYFKNSVVNCDEFMKDITTDISRGISPGIISARFHNGMVNAIKTVCLHLRQVSGIKKVILSGGTFQNRFLLEKSELLLQREGFEVYSNQQVPSNDGGIALGQLYIAAKNRKLCV